MKTGKEIKINKFKNYNVVFGSVNNKHPKAVYINISAWAEPKHEEGINYPRVIRELNKKIKQSLYNSFDSDPNTNFLKNTTILDLDIRESGIKYGKRSFINCEVTLFLDTEISVNTELMQDMLSSTTNMLIDTVFNTNKNFNFYNKKK
jgi:hypothetical protein